MHRFLHSRNSFSTCAIAAICGGVQLNGESSRTQNDANYHDRIVGNYENRIRKFSSPERVFHYFASVQTDDGDFMTEKDFIRSFTPYTQRDSEIVGSPNFKFNSRVMYTKPSQDNIEKYRRLVRKAIEDDCIDASELKSLAVKQKEWNIDLGTHIKVLKELQLTLRQYENLIEGKGGPTIQRNFFNLVDADGDGLISYPEYMLYMTLLTIPERQFEIAFQMFDENDNGEIDKFEFKEMIRTLCLRTPAGKQDRSLSYESIPTFPRFFGNDGTKCLSYKEFNDFRKKLQEEIIRMQFKMFDVDGNGELSAMEFGMYLVSHVTQQRAGFWSMRVKEYLSQMPITLSEEAFHHFARFLQNLDAMEVAMNLISPTNKGLDRGQFFSAAQAAVMGKDIIISQEHIEILFALFDLDGDNLLDVAEFIDVMRKRSTLGMDQPRDLGVIDWIKFVLNCACKE